MFSNDGAVQADGATLAGGASDGERETTSPKLSADFSMAEVAVGHFWPIGCYVL